MFSAGAKYSLQSDRPAPCFVSLALFPSRCCCKHGEVTHKWCFRLEKQLVYLLIIDATLQAPNGGCPCKQSNEPIGESDNEPGRRCGRNRLLVEAWLPGGDQRQELQELVADTRCFIQPLWHPGICGHGEAPVTASPLVLAQQGALGFGFGCLYLAAKLN